MLWLRIRISIGLASVVGLLASIIFFLIPDTRSAMAFICIFPPAFILAFPIMFLFLAPSFSSYQARRLQDIPEGSDKEIASLRSDVLGWLMPGEELQGFTIGIAKGEEYPIVIALTRTRIILSSLYTSRDIDLHDVKYLGWSAFSAKLKLEFHSTKTIFELEITGAKWKVQAENLVQAFHNQCDKEVG